MMICAATYIRVAETQVVDHVTMENRPGNTDLCCHLRYRANCLPAHVAVKPEVSAHGF